MSNTLSSVTSSSGNTQLDQLVNAYRSTQQSKIDTLNQKKTDLENKQSFFNTLNTKISALVNEIDKYSSSSILDNFTSRKVTSSDSTVLTATAKGEAALANYSLNVNRIATSDVLISDRKNLSDSFGIEAGTKSFDITINGDTKTVNVTLDGTETNEQALKKIADAINNTEDIEVSGAYIKDTNSTGRLTLTSKDSGGENNIKFSDTDGVLAQLGLDSAALEAGTASRTVSTSTSAGYAKADYNNLDSEISVNGITITRSSNTIDDILQGVTLKLLKPQESDSQPVILSTDVDTAGVKNFINSIVTSYNDLLNFISQRQDVRRSDSSISNLYFTLRDIVTQAINPANSGDPKYLTDIGLKPGTNNGVLAFDSGGDTDLLQTALESNPNGVAQLFTASDGFVARLNSAISVFTGSDGLIQSRTKSLSSQIDSTVKRTSNVQATIDTQAEALRKQYTSYLTTLYQAQNQYSLLSTFDTSSLSSGYNSLLG